MSPLLQNGTHESFIPVTEGDNKQNCMYTYSKRNNVQIVQESPESHSMEVYSLYEMKSEKQHQPYTVTLEVNEYPLVMEIDDGTSFSIISEPTSR